jgi:hypothetical protein
MEQLVVLGNGFDLACQLKSKYSDFYQSKYKEPYKSLLDEFCLNISKINMHEEIGSTVDFFNKLEDDKEFEQLLESSNALNIWDIIFGSRFYENVKSKSWTDIEQTIEKYIIRLYRACIKGEDRASYLPIIVVLEFKMRVKWENLVHEIEQKGEKIEFAWEYYSEILLEQLNKFENNFTAYLNGAINNRVYKQSVSELFMEIIQRYDAEGTSRKISLNELTTNVLSFNYTEVEKVGQQKNVLINEFRNVHGKLSRARDGIIFGIDLQQLKKSESDETRDNQQSFLEFTKTFRTLKMVKSFGTQKLYSKETKQIKFYGHGLGEADYSYFMSIFDAVELYSGETVLVFFYNPDLEDEEAKQFRRVANLIIKYAETLKNENHGDNLLHKLILENRIKILPLAYSVEK